MTNDDKNVLDEKIIQEMLVAYVDGRIWPEKTNNYGFGDNDVRGMQNVLALLVQKGYTRPQPSGDAVKALDWCDLMVDEFMRIKSCPNVSDEIKQLCERAIKNTHQHLPVILQRDTLQRKVNELEHAALTQPKADVVDLDSLKREVKKYLDSKVDGYWWDDIITYLHDKGYLAAQGYIGVPEGYALVPIEPTDEILNAMAEQCDGYNENYYFDIYKAMLKAAPKKEGV